MSGVELLQEGGMNREAKILVIGGNGYIGSRVVQQLLSMGRPVTAVDCFLRPDANKTAPYPIIDSAYQDLDLEFLASFTDCIWLAGHASVPQAMGDPKGALNNNFFDLIKFRARFDGRLIYASSGSVYSRNKPEECTEESFLANPSN
jgi:nucleoside-diphosphate-sugar epimerase